MYPITSDLLPIPDFIRGEECSSDEDVFPDNHTSSITPRLDNSVNNFYDAPDVLHYDNDYLLDHRHVEDGSFIPAHDISHSTTAENVEIDNVVDGINLRDSSISIAPSANNVDDGINLRASNNISIHPSANVDIPDHHRKRQRKQPYWMRTGDYEL